MFFRYFMYYKVYYKKVQISQQIMISQRNLNFFDEDEKVKELMLTNIAGEINERTHVDTCLK